MVHALKRNGENAFLKDELRF